MCIKDLQFALSSKAKWETMCMSRWSEELGFAKWECWL